MKKMLLIAALSLGCQATFAQDMAAQAEQMDTVQMNARGHGGGGHFGGGHFGGGHSGGHSGGGAIVGGIIGGILGGVIAGSVNQPRPVSVVCYVRGYYGETFQAYAYDQNLAMNQAMYNCQSSSASCAPAGCQYY